MFPRLTFPPKLLKQTAIYLAVWVLCLADWMWARSGETWRVWPEGIWFSLSFPLSAYWIAWAGWLCRFEDGEQASIEASLQMVRGHFPSAKADSGQSADESAFLIRRHLVWSVSATFLWQLSVFFADAFNLHSARVGLATWGTLGLFFLGLVWVVWIVERASHFENLKLPETFDYALVPALSFGVIFGIVLAASLTTMGSALARKTSPDSVAVDSLPSVALAELPA